MLGSVCFHVSHSKRNCKLTPKQILEKKTNFYKPNSSLVLF